MMETIDISVVMPVYNHRKYVSEAIESVLSQKHDLTVEILIIDDASTDGTAEILRYYKKKYPKLIKLRCNKINSKHPTKNVYQAILRAKGKYIAILEGDDYWISSEKLKKQYDFLEKSPQYSAYAGNVQVVDSCGEIIENQTFYTPQDNGSYTLDDFRTLRMPAMAGGFFCRNIFLQEDLEILYTADKMMGDLTIFMLCLLHGAIYQSKEILSAYRYVCTTGESNFNSINKDNLWKDYNCLKYWTKLERYIHTHKDSSYRMDIIKNGILSCEKKYAISAMMKLLIETRNVRYILIYLLSRHISYFWIDSENIKCVSTKKWNDFLYDKSPLVIFGAGQRAAEYLDQYAWRDNILFIADNDKRKQNTSFKGFLVKNPNEILNQKCKVLIINEKYEAEIEQQLLDMGVSNYYCFFAMQSRRLSNKLIAFL